MRVIPRRASFVLFSASTKLFCTALHFYEQRPLNGQFSLDNTQFLQKRALCVVSQWDFPELFVRWLAELLCVLSCRYSSASVVDHAIQSLLEVKAQDIGEVRHINIFSRLKPYSFCFKGHDYPVFAGRRHISIHATRDLGSSILPRLFFFCRLFSLAV